MDKDNLKVYANILVKPSNGGLFISRGLGKHPERIIDSYEIIFVSSGKLEIYEENTEYCVGEGQVLILYPGIKHGGLNTYPPDLSFYWLHFYLEPDESGAANMLFETQKHVKISSPEAMTELFRKFLDNQEHGFKSIYKQSLTLMQMLCEIHDSCIIENPDMINNIFAELANAHSK